ncbi:MAG TPA: SUF system NifU family Fe-S cluster assembly protein [Acidimicrobiia bacterium]
MALEDLYREVILDHYRNPRNRAPLTRVDSTAEGVNPLCGDEVTVELEFEGDRVSGVRVQGQGCSISQSSASMMGTAIKGKRRAEVADLIRRFKGMMDIESDASVVDADRPGAVLGDLEALQGVRQYPVRIKCANLAWTTLEEALSA